MYVIIKIIHPKSHKIKSIQLKGENIEMEEFKQKVTNMSNLELKENIIKFNLDKLNNINKSSYLNAFGAIMSLKNVLDKREELDYINNLSEVDLFKEYLNTAIRLIDEFIYEKKRTVNLESALNIRKELYTILKIVEGYYIELSYVGEIVDNRSMIINAQDSYSGNNSILDIEKTIKLIENKLELSKGDYTMYNYVVSQIINFIPIKITKHKYLNIIENCLKRNLKSSTTQEVEDKINYYKSQWDSSLQYGYGVKFDKYFAKIQKLKNINLKDKNLEELQDIANQIINLTKDINELYNFILILGLTYNMIITIHLGKEIQLEEDILEIKKHWNDALNTNDKNTIDKFIKLNEEKIRETEKNTIAYIEEFQELNKEAIKRDNFPDDELEDIFLYTKEILTYYNDYNLENMDVLLSKDNELVSSEYLDESINSLIGYIKRSFIRMDNIERKVRMKKLLSLVELPFSNIQEFKNYIRYSLDDKVSSTKETKFIIENILGFIQSIQDKTNY